MKCLVVVCGAWNGLKQGAMLVQDLKAGAGVGFVNVADEFFNAQISGGHVISWVGAIVAQKKDVSPDCIFIPWPTANMK